MMQKFLIHFLFLGLGAAVQAAPTFAGKVAAVECRSRGGVGHVMEKVRAGEPVKIAYFGGSITEMDGWRRFSREWLQTRYPACAFSEIQAAIGGTGSRMGVFRFAQDVLDKKPDLIFVEFATNDASLQPDAIWRNFDGFIRQAWTRDPEIDIVFVYTITKPMMSDYGVGRCPTAASAMEQLADYYGIPSINFGPRVAADVNAGTLVMTIGEVETAVPENTPERDALISAELAKEGKMLFSKDGVHPALPGHEKYYLTSFTNAWPQLENAEPANHAATLSAPFSEATMEAAKLVSIQPSMVAGNWRQLESNEPNGNFNARFGDKVWFTETPGARLRFRFRGTECLIYDLVGPACGQLWLIVDGVRRPAPVPRFDNYCTYYRTIAFEVFQGASGVHEIELELDAEQPDRSSVMASGVTATELASAKYNGTKWYAGRLMVVGDVLPEPSSAWFDARVDRYAAWPRDAARAVRGNWTTPGGTLEDAAAVAKAGVLEAAGAAPLVFAAEQAKGPDAKTREIRVETEMTFQAHTVDKLPAPDPTAKAAVILVDDGGTLGYYALGCENGGPAWLKLEGVPVAAPGRTVKLTVSFRLVAGALCVGYSFEGVRAQQAGRREWPVAEAGAMSEVSYEGSSEIRSLRATADPFEGLKFVVR